MNQGAVQPVAGIGKKQADEINTRSILTNSVLGVIFGIVSYLSGISITFSILIAIATPVVGYIIGKVENWVVFGDGHDHGHDHDHDDKKGNSKSNEKETTTQEVNPQPITQQQVPLQAFMPPTATQPPQSTTIQQNSPTQQPHENLNAAKPVEIKTQAQ